MNYRMVIMCVKDLMLEKQLLKVVFLAVAVFAIGIYPITGSAQTGLEAELPVPRTPDFAIDGRGTAPQWERAEWMAIEQRATTERMARNKAPAPATMLPPAKLSTRAKVLYSETGIYFLVQCEDRVLQATMEEDLMELWWEDVVEIFIWPDESDPTYFEYQISPLGYELLLRITNNDRGRSSWMPFRYGGSRGTRHKTSVEGGKRNSGSSISRWTAELFMPYGLLHPAGNIPPEPGTRWRVNLYRLDYDTGGRTRWEWQPVKGNHHDISKFGTFLFE